jgi:F-type H+-transporting ATPase subunit a
MRTKIIPYSILLFFLLFPLIIFAEDHPAGENKLNHATNAHSGKEDIEETAHGDEKFNPKDFIFHHIQDAHSWHIITVNGKHINIPLPVILISKHSGFHVFMSSHLVHEHVYEHGDSKFQLPHHGKNSGKIIELDDQENVLTKTIEKDGEKIEKAVVPFDLSITKNVFAAIFSIFIMLLLFPRIAKRYKENSLRAPKGAQSMFEPIIIFIRDEVARPYIGHHYERFMPYLLTIFFFIWFNNMLGLVPVFPGGANLTGNIMVTGTLALFTYFVTTFSGNKNYWIHIFNTPGVPWWLKVPLPLMPIIELLGTFIKPITLMIRLFANIAGGHIIVLSFFAMIFIFAEMNPAAGYGASPLIIAFTVFMTFLELLVALIQAYVFTMLSALYFGMATEEAHH